MKVYHLFFLIPVFVVIIILLNYMSSYYESTTFNKLTGARTTVFDALWVELRVDCQNIK